MIPLPFKRRYRGWHYRYVCEECGYHQSQDRGKRVCPDCGHAAEENIENWGHAKSIWKRVRMRQVIVDWNRYPRRQMGAYWQLHPSSDLPDSLPSRVIAH